MASSGARGGMTKGGQRANLSRTQVQSLGGGNWAKGVNKLRSGTATNNEIAKAKGQATSGQRAAQTRKANTERRAAAGRPNRSLSTTRTMNSVRRDILGGRTGTSSTGGFNIGR